MSDIVGNNEPLQKIICNNCRHKKPGISCAAFEKIPDEIVFGDNDHSKPLPYQKNKIVFEPKEDMEIAKLIK